MTPCSTVNAPRTAALEPARVPELSITLIPSTHLPSTQQEVDFHSGLSRGAQLSKGAYPPLPPLRSQRLEIQTQAL